MQYENELWFCALCGYSTPKDDCFNDEATLSDDLDMEDEAILERFTKTTDWSGS